VTIVGVGGGLIGPMQSRWEQNLSKASQESTNIKSQMQSSKQGGQQQQQAYDQYQPASVRTASSQR